jgi:UDP-N-acetylglucosamine diphosphorylase / glucose-1-phosphate thymidylyltransferase / UDP-N-acetylgalactosamine diphosphorylase / glucosamine-1-phosphate N-acetyltransferase / galactosamine-1-phosphate N-acetyltransferase
MIAIMPMAGRGSRFAGSSYNAPKPLIEVNGMPMFLLALESLKGINTSQLIIISLKEHEYDYKISELIKKHITLPTKLVLLDEVTQGQLCTVMAAEPYIDTPEDILIVSSDTIIQSTLGDDIQHKDHDCKGIISVADMPGDRWSFASVDDQGRVNRVTEKVRISNHASTGMYYFSSGNEFCLLANEILKNHERTKGEYYVMPIYQKYIDKGEVITISHAQCMWDLGTPESLKKYLDFIQEDKTN